MQVKVPGFDVSIKVIWVVIAFAWHALFGAALWYVGYKISQYQIEHKVEMTDNRISGLDQTIQDRIKITEDAKKEQNQRFVNLEATTSRTEQKVGNIEGEVKGISKQMDNMVLLMAGILNKGKTADNNTSVGIHPAVYEVEN